MNIQEKLKELRISAKLTQEQVGRAIFNEGAELTKAAISQYELGKKKYSVRYFRKMIESIWLRIRNS